MVQLGWTVTDELLCIQEDGSVLIYDLFGSFKRHFSMGQVSPSACSATQLSLTHTRMYALGQAGRLLLLSPTGSGPESGAGSQSLPFSLRDGRGHRERLVPFHLGDQHR